MEKLLENSSFGKGPYVLVAFIKTLNSYKRCKGAKTHVTLKFLRNAWVSRLLEAFVIGVHYVKVHLGTGR